MSRSETRRAILAYLQSHGPITDPQGHATGVLKAAISDTSAPMAFTQLVASLARSGAITRQVRGKRTYAIAVPAEASGQSAAADSAGPTVPKGTTGPTVPAEAADRGTTLAGTTGPTVPAEAADRGTPAVRVLPGGGTAESGTEPTASATGSAPGRRRPRQEHAAGGVDAAGFDDEADAVAAALLARVTKLLTSDSRPAGWARRRIDKLETQVAELERALARAQAEARTVAEQRDELQLRLERAEQNLVVVTSRLERDRPDAKRSAGGRLGPAERALLRELRGGDSRSEQVG